MRKLTSVLVVTAFWAAAAPPTALAAMPAQRIWGKVTHVDVAKKEVVVTAELRSHQWKEIRFSFTDASKVRVGKKADGVPALKGGDDVTVTYTVRNGVYEVRELVVHPAEIPSALEKK